MSYSHPHIKEVSKGQVLTGRDLLRRQIIERYENSSDKNSFAKGGGLDWSNPFKNGNTQQAGLSMASDVIGGAGNKVLSGGLSSGAGNVIGGLSNIASAIPGPWGAVAGAGLQIIGGLTNRMFGSKINEEKVAEVKNNIASMDANIATAGDYSTLENNMMSDINFTKKDIGKDGWFSNKAGKLYNKLHAQADILNQRKDISTLTSANQIAERTTDNLLRNYAAEGGSLNRDVNRFDGLSGTSSLQGPYIFNEPITGNEGIEQLKEQPQLQGVDEKGNLREGWIGNDIIGYYNTNATKDPSRYSYGNPTAVDNEAINSLKQQLGSPTPTEPEVSQFKSVNWDNVWKDASSIAKNFARTTAHKGTVTPISQSSGQDYSAAFNTIGNSIAGTMNIMDTLMKAGSKRWNDNRTLGQKIGLANGGDLNNGGKVLTGRDLLRQSIIHRVNKFSGENDSSAIQIAGNQSLYGPNGSTDAPEWMSQGIDTSSFSSGSTGGKGFDSGKVEKYANAAADAIQLAANAIDQGRLSVSRSEINQAQQGTQQGGQVLTGYDIIEANRPQPMQHVNRYDFRKNTLGMDVVNGVSAGNTGAMAGMALTNSPWGAAIGGVIGTASSVAGSLIGRHKAGNEAKKTNYLVDLGNARNDLAYNTSIQQTAEKQVDNLLQNWAAYGGLLRKWK